MKDLNSNQWFVIAIALAFLGFVAFFNVDSAWADEHNYNTELVVTGVISILVGLICLLKAKETSN